MAQQHPARGEDARADRGLPVGAGQGRVDLGDDHVEHAVEQFVLVRDVLVERHRYDVELVGEPPHAERVRPVAIGQGHGGRQDPLPVEGGPRLRLARRRRHRLDKCTPYTLGLAHRCTAYTTTREAVDEGDRAGPVRLGGRAGASGRARPGDRRGRGAHPGAGGGMRTGRVAPHDGPPVLRAAHAGVPPGVEGAAGPRRRRRDRAGRPRRDGVRARRRGDGDRRRLVRGARRRLAVHARAKARSAVVRAGGRRADLRAHGAPSGARRGRCPGGTARARDRRRRRCGHARRADREGVRRARDRRVQRREGRAGPLAWRRRGDRLHARGRHRRPAHLGRDRRHGGEAVVAVVAPGARAEGLARDRGRRRRREDHGWVLPPDPARAGAIAVHGPAHASGHGEGARGGPGRAREADRRRRGHTGRRSNVRAGRCTGGGALPGGGTRSREGHRSGLTSAAIRARARSCSTVSYIKAEVRGSRRR